jgi:nucleoside-diphosphate-sugar epimerase
VTGLDSFLFRECFLGDPPAGIPATCVDIRRVGRDALRGFDGVIHLAGLSNDPLGDLDPPTTLAINFRAAVKLAKAARSVGVKRFAYASSCGSYGAGGEDLIDEVCPLQPLTPYARSKMLAERGLAELADRSFCPTFLRLGTAYGMSPKLRADLVVNNLVGHALTSSRVLLKSDGSAWRPLVHVQDIARAFAAVMEAPRERVFNEAFNVGATDENYRIREVAEMVAAAVPGAEVAAAKGAGTDQRSYRVDCGKILRRLPACRPEWTLGRGIRQLSDGLRACGLNEARFKSSALWRRERLLELRAQGVIDSRFYRTTPADESGTSAERQPARIGGGDQ